MPNMLVHAQDLHALEAGRVVRRLDHDWSNLGPDRVPGRAQLAGEAQERSRLTAELSDFPPDHPRAQQPCGLQTFVLLDESGFVAERLAADPATFAPPAPHRPTRPGRVDHRGHHPAVTCSDESTARTSGDGFAGLHPRPWG